MEQSSLKPSQTPTISSTPKKTRFRRWKWALISIICLGLIAIGSLWFFAPLPKAVPPRGVSHTREVPVEISVITVPISISVSQLEQQIAKQFPKVLINQKGQKVDNGYLLDIKAFRSGPFRIRDKRGKLIASLPTIVEARLYKEKRAQKRKKKGKSPPVGTQVSAKLVIQASIDLSVADDWHLKIKSSFSHRWLSKPKIKIGPFRFGIEKIADKLLEEQWPIIAKRINAQSKQNEDPLRPAIENLWTQINTPRPLQKEPPTWLTSDSVGIYLSSPLIEDGLIRFNVGFSGQFRFVLGTPPLPKEVPPLPPRRAPPENEGFRLVISTALYWDTMSALASEQLAGNVWPISENGSQITTKHIEIYPSEKQFVVVLSYDATLPAWTTEGTLYLIGQPVLDEKNRTLSIEHFDYILHTWDKTIASVNALVKSGLKEDIEKNLLFPFGKQLDEVQKQINEGLIESFAQSGGQMIGHLDTLELRGLRLTENAMLIEAVASGAISFYPDIGQKRKEP